VARTRPKEYRPCHARRGCPAREIFFCARGACDARAGFEPHAAKRHLACRLTVLRTRSREAHLTVPIVVFHNYRRSNCALLQILFQALDNAVA